MSLNTLRDQLLARLGPELFRGAETRAGYTEDGRPMIAVGDVEYVLEGGEPFAVRDHGGRRVYARVREDGTLDSPGVLPPADPGAN